MKNEGDAVSSVVGVVLIISFVVILGAIVAQIIFTTSGALEHPKIAAVTIEFTKDSFMYFRGGQDLASMQSVTLTGDGRAGAYIFKPNDPELTKRFPEGVTILITISENIIDDIITGVRAQYADGHTIVVADIKDDISGEIVYSIAFPQDGRLPGPFTPGRMISIFPGVDMLDDPRNPNQIVVVGTWPDQSSAVLFSKLHYDTG
ncbi:MAG: type IV pilin N-terminal domain-containing protein [Methanocalculus sp.]|uniref:type IV pilin N-terminal domain-containing protein n=1 Tax=Methanocalculus sp. TaxID=2004547 RepID=UPI002726AE8C|nr:type IV pilin N-terminal domain-containing protein [Methanocalculus sp.]MDO9540238.1 type IV pilin N-terminal domain-containing protein [Methanocalculus sp.]